MGVPLKDSVFSPRVIMSGPTFFSYEIIKFYCLNMLFDYEKSVAFIKFPEVPMNSQ